METYMVKVTCPLFNAAINYTKLFPPNGGRGLDMTFDHFQQHQSFFEAS